MARDETARERGSESGHSLLGHPPHRQRAGATAATVAGPDVAGASTARPTDALATREVRDGAE